MEPRSGCAINAAVEALGDQWSFLVLRDIIFGNRRYFREMLAGSIEGIASNILADRLKRFVAAGSSPRTMSPGANASATASPKRHSDVADHLRAG